MAAAVAFVTHVVAGVPVYAHRLSVAVMTEAGGGCAKACS
jgi:hypothetical protein